jgi:beta-xylosidase
MLCAAHGQSQATANLAQLGWYADPEIHIFAGQYWIYPTSSGQNGDRKDRQTFNPLQREILQKKIREFSGGHAVDLEHLPHASLDALSSPDLVHWTVHPDVLNIKNVPWAAYAIWAPSAIHLNGKYYLFFAANDIQEHDTFPGGIGVAVSDLPGGPFIDLLGKPLIGEYHNGAQPIDPMVFEDDDGTIYLYYGGHSHCNVARLSSDLKRVIPMQNGAIYKEIAPEHYVEGPFIIKRNAIYYLMWSEGNWENSTYGVAYARSGSPTGPFQRIGKILETDPAIANGPGHHSVLRFPGADDWYIVYHRHPLGTTGAGERVLAIDRMVFDANGNIEPVKMTTDGVRPRPLPPGTKDR